MYNVYNIEIIFLISVNKLIEFNLNNILKFNCFNIDIILQPMHSWGINSLTY